MTHAARGAVVRTVGLAAAMALGLAAFGAGFARAETAVIIVLDPGHGGTDNGATGHQLREAEVTLDIARRIKALLDLDSQDPAKGGLWQVLLTRDGDVAKTVDERVMFANQSNAARFVSIHVHSDASPATAGTVTTSFADTAGNTGTTLRDTLHTAVVSAFARGDRGKSIDQVDPVLKQTTMPAVTQVIGLMSNPQDAQRLGASDGRRAIAEAYVRALQAHFGLTPYIPPTTGEVGGRVVANNSGAAVAATVSVDGAQPTATGADGTYLLTSILPGVHRIIAQAAGFTSASQSVTVVAGVRAAVELRLASGGAPVTLTVSVTNAATGEPVEAASVSAAGGTGSTDAQGKVTLTVAAGTQTVTVQAPGFATVARDFAVAPGAGNGTIALTPIDPQSSPGNVSATGCAAAATGAFGGPWLAIGWLLVGLLPHRRRPRAHP
jgi:N-acetylmuramoyl-L-alanine amidase